MSAIKSLQIITGDLIDLLQDTIDSEVLSLDIFRKMFRGDVWLCCYASCLSSSCLLVMPLMFTCSIDIPVTRDVLFGLCGMFLGGMF